MLFSFRLELQPTPTREKRSRSQRDLGSQLPPKRTKRSRELTTSSSAVGPIQICEVDPEGRFVQIKNISDKVDQRFCSA